MGLRCMAMGRLERLAKISCDDFIYVRYAVALNNWVLVGSNHLNSSVGGQNFWMNVAKGFAVVSRSIAIESCLYCGAA